MFRVLTFSVPAISCAVFLNHFNVEAKENQLKLQSVQVVFRHGARTPVTSNTPYVELPNSGEMVWDRDILMRTLPHTDIEYDVRMKDGSERMPSPVEAYYRRVGPYKGGCLTGQLTTIGQQDGFMLGKYLKHEYIKKHKLISGYNSEQVYIRSSNIDRTILTARCLLAGMFGKQGFKEKKPVMETVDLNEEYIYPNYNTCEHVRTWKSHLFKVYKTIFDHAGDYERIYDVLQATNIHFIALLDFIHCRRAHGMEIPDYLLEEEHVISHRAAQLQAHILEGGGDRELALRRSIGAFVEEFCSNIENNSKTKVYLYSAHDTTIVALLQVLDSWDVEMPHFCSNIALEVYTDQEERKFIRILYNGKPLLLNIEGCCEYYPLEKFLRFVEKFRVKDWNVECGNEKRKPSNFSS